MIPLTVLRLRALFSPTQRLHLPGYTGSLWRGVFGHAFKRVVCGLDRADGCAGCPLIAGCPYPLFFEEGLHRIGRTTARHSAPPRPFVVEPGPERETVEPDESLTVAMVLIGDAGRWAPSVAQALQLAGLHGVGHRRVPLEPLGIEYQHADGAWRTVGAPPQPLIAPPPPERLTVRFETPLRLKRDGHLVSPERFLLTDLQRALHRRTEALAELYGDGPLDLPPSTLPDPSPHHTLRWQEWSRWSNRQRSHMNLGGLIGDLPLEGPALTALWPLLWAGQWLHAGGNASFGLGGYRLLP